MSNSAAIRTTQADTSPGMIDLAIGHPGSSLLPTEIMRQAAEHRLGTGDPSYLQYGYEQGDGYFRRVLAEFLSTTGTFTIPLMKATGYRAEFAGGIEACASNGGHLMPPVMGAVAFIMAEMLSVPYIEICYIAFIPAILYYICMFVQVDLEAARTGLRGLPASQIPSFKSAIRTGWIHGIPPLILIYILFVLKYSPELAAFWAVISIIRYCISIEIRWWWRWRGWFSNHDIIRFRRCVRTIWP